MHRAIAFCLPVSILVGCGSAPDGAPGSSDTSTDRDGVSQDRMGNAIDSRPREAKIPDVKVEPPDDCRQSPCPAAHYCDIASGKCKPGCGNDSQCPQPGMCDIAAHSCRCNNGYHSCPGQCVSNTSVATCGASCNACPTDPNGSATCDGQICGLKCGAGFVSCGGKCVICSGNKYCAAGTCVSCTPGTGNCNGDSTDGCETVLTSPQNCGACGQKATFKCLRDSDGDTFGVDNDISYVCGSTCPAGWTTKGGDCDDENKDAFPGQTMFLSTRPPKATTWDLNCDGKIEKSICGHQYESGKDMDLNLSINCHAFDNDLKKCGFTGSGYHSPTTYAWKGAAAPACGQTGSPYYCDYDLCSNVYGGCDPDTNLCFTYNLCSSGTVGCR